LEDETVWLTQQMMIALFQSSKTNISEHIANIFAEKELDRNSTVRNFRTVQKEGRREVARNIKYYNLDMIISVGYRVRSKTATQFRRWATKTLKEYLIKGYALNERKLKEKDRQFRTLKTAIDLIERGMTNQIEETPAIKHMYAFLKDFASGLELLDDYDRALLDKFGDSKRTAVLIEPKEFLEIVQSMRQQFPNDVFGISKDDSFVSSIRQVYQSIGENDCYPPLEEKAAMLLYLVVKNHPFADGNKRIAAACFLYFLEKNHLLRRKDGSTVVDSNTLFALTLLVAESKPAEMETKKNIVITMLNRGKQVDDI
jgi:prophage maintenance system killer protein